MDIPVAKLWGGKPEVLDRQQCSFVRSVGEHTIEDCFSKIEVIGKGTGHYYTLRINNLQAGQYLLSLRGMNKVTISINVHRGQFLESMGKVILKRNCIQELASSQQMIKIKESEITADTIKFKLVDFSPNARAHIFATNYVSNNSEAMINCLRRMMTSTFSHTVFTFAKWTNLLLSDRQLSDEYRYVFDRR